MCLLLRHWFLSGCLCFWETDWICRSLVSLQVTRHRLWKVAGVAHWKKAEGADIEIEAKELLGGDLKYGKFVKTKGTVQKMYWHIHHEVLMEYLTEPLKNRIEYIKTNKPEHERDIRLKLLKAVKGPIRDYRKDHQRWESLHKKECKNCPWNGHTIFPLK